MQKYNHVKYSQSNLSTVQSNLGLPVCLHEKVISLRPNTDNISFHVEANDNIKEIHLVLTGGGMSLSVRLNFSFPGVSTGCVWTDSAAAI